MMKRFVCCLLALMVLLVAALPAVAEETEKKSFVLVRRPEDLCLLAENCRLDTYSQDLVVKLTRDLDLSGTDFSSIPYFSGTFLGNGHTISGIQLDTSGSYQGFFRYLSGTAVVEDLHLEAELAPQGSKSAVGGFAGENAGRITGCSFSGSISGGDRVGGIAGENTLTGVIEDCTVDGTLSGNHFVGGIVGDNSGVIRNCENTAAINTTAQQNQVSLSDISLSTLTDTESANTVTDVGGIAGTSSGVLNECVNRGNVGYRQMGYNVGGIVGSQTGTVTRCGNHGSVSGRKEVGGIVGHLEPAAQIEYSEDALQILERQVAALNSSVNRAASNVRSTAMELSGTITEMSWYVSDAWDAISILKPNEENPILPNPDTLTAVRNGLSTSLNNMTNAMRSVNDIANGSMGALGANISSIQRQVSAMGETLNNASETLGGKVEDVSDQDTEADLSGKVAHCVNHGTVTADMNLGGIAGAIALQSELNAVESIQVAGENSMNFVSKVRAVVRDCENLGEVSGTKQNLGGIVGYQTLGLIHSAENTASVGEEGAQYVGGIVGNSTGYVRSSNAKCQLAGEVYVGGIAGSGAVATDCRSMIAITGGREKTGAVLGMAAENIKQVEDPIHSNLYTFHGADPGGIDGISYAGKAEGAEREAFLAMADTPELFRTVTVTFRQEYGAGIKRTVKPGGALPEDQIPLLPAKPGYEAFWQGLEEADLSHICFDMSFDAAYTRHIATIETAQTRDGLPVLLLQGSFLGTAHVALGEAVVPPALTESETLAECREIVISDAVEVTAGRYLFQPREGEHPHILVRRADGSWEQRPCSENGSYLTFAMDGTETALALTWEKEEAWLAYALAGAAVLALGLVVLAVRKRK